MSEVEALLAAYQATEDDDEKPDLISDLEAFFDQDSVRALLIKVISDAAEYYLARIEALRVLEVQQPPQGERAAFISAITSVLESEPDEVVRQWAGRSLKAFADDPSADGGRYPTEAIDKSVCRGGFRGRSPKPSTSHSAAGCTTPPSASNQRNVVRLDATAELYESEVQVLDGLGVHTATPTTSCSKPPVLVPLSLRPPNRR